MRYYVVSDVHGFYDELIKALTEQGFFEDKEPHKLIVCGDLLDRGKQTNELVKFALDLLQKDELIYIRGNHEDLLETLLQDLSGEFADRALWGIIQGTSYHVHNGTWQSAVDLSEMGIGYIYKDPIKGVEEIKKSEYYTKLLQTAIDYYETDNYIFVHGWIPVKDMRGVLEYRDDWRTASKEDWSSARWYCGMDMAMRFKITEPNKTIVCGHYHTSYGHSIYEHKCSEFGEDADFSPFYADGIIAIDCCTALSSKVNCVVIDD